MVAAAVIIVPDTTGVSPLTRIGGLSLVKRAVLTAQKAGVTRCLLSGGDAAAALQRELHNDPRVTCTVVWLKGDQTGPLLHGGDEQNFSLVFTVDTIFHHPVVRELVRHSVPGQTLVATDTVGSPVLALLPCLHLPQLLAELAHGTPLHHTAILAHSTKLALASSGPHFLTRLTSTTPLAQVEHALLLSLENPRDGIVDTYCNRKLSRLLTRWLLRTPLTPNQITLLAGSVGLLGALCFLPGGYYGPLLGALLLQLSVVLDCCDGEVARVKFLESPWGDWLDIVCDTVVGIAIFLGIGVAVWRDGTVTHALTLAGILTIGGALAFPLVTLAERTEAIGEQRNGWEDVTIKTLVDALTTRDFSVIILASAAAGKLSWFLWGAAIGAQVFCLILAWLLFRAGRFGLIRKMGERNRV